MNITHVVESLGRGGLERMVIDLVEAQLQQGHKCLIVCLFNAGELAEEARGKGIECIVCSKKKGIDLSVIYKLRKAFKQNSTEVIHTHNAVAHYYAYFSSFMLKIKCFLNTRHGLGARDPNAKREKHYKSTLRRTNYVVAVCEAAKKKLIEDGIVDRERCVVVPNGIKVNSYISIKNKNSNNSALGKVKKSKNLIIGSVGRLNWAKDYFTLLDSFKLLSEEYDHISLEIIGGGALREKLQEHVSKIGVSDLVELLGDKEDVKPFLSNMDIFVMSSVSEGYSIALLEACAVGLPIVATDVGGNSEIVQHGKNGLIVPPKDPVALAKNISALIQDKNMCKQFALLGQKWVLEHGNVSHMAKCYEKLYKKAPD